MAITISTHNGSKFSLMHNRRDAKTVAKENEKFAKRYPGKLRIDPSGHFEIWKDGNLRKTYEMLFSESVTKWNEKCAKNGHPERCIKDYLAEICAKEKSAKGAKHPLYEIIYAVGNKEHPVEEKTTLRILKELVDGFEIRNPHLYVLGAYYHADEIGVAHVHLNYIPVATMQTRGMETQNNLSAALKQQGITSNSWHDTAQMRWEKQENEVLETICNRYGYEVEHPQAGTRQEHLEIEEYRVTKEIEALEKKLSENTQLPTGTVLVKKGHLKELEDKGKLYDLNIDKIAQAERNLKAASDAMTAYAKAYTALQHDKANFEQRVNEVANSKIAQLKDSAISFIKTHNLWTEYEKWAENVTSKLFHADGIKK